MKQRKAKDSVSGAQEIAAERRLSGHYRVPPGVELSEAENLVFQGWAGSRPAEDWSEAELRMLCRAAKLEREITAQETALLDEDAIVESSGGQKYMNPRYRIIQQSERALQSIFSKLHVGVDAKDAAVPNSRGRGRAPAPVLPATPKAPVSWVEQARKELGE